MSAHRFEYFEDSTPDPGDMADVYYLGTVHNLIKIGELTPSQEEAGGISIRSHGVHMVTRPVERAKTEKVVPILYFGKIGLNQ